LNDQKIFKFLLAKVLEKNKMGSNYFPTRGAEGMLVATYISLLV